MQSETLVRLVKDVATAVDVKTAVRVLRLSGTAMGRDVAIYRSAGAGLELVLGLRDGDTWLRLPASLTAVPRSLEAVRHAPPGTWTAIPSEDGEIPELAGHACVALSTDNRLSGFLFLDKAPSDEDAPCIQVLSGLLGLHLRVSRDALELKRLREERYEHLVKTETLAATGMLSAGVAHELNNPLGVVLGLAELLALDESCPERVRADARVMVEAASRAVSVVRQLLSYGRGGGMDLEPAELIELVESCARIFETAQSGPGIEVVREYESGPVLVLCDPFRLQQAFLALFDNARHAVLSATRQGRIVVRVEQTENGRVAVRLTDNGLGVEPAIRSRIFDPFFTTREVGSGTGMGLALVHRTVMDHGGDVRFEPAPGGGASFVIELERHDA